MLEHAETVSFMKICFHDFPCMLVFTGQLFFKQFPLVPRKHCLGSTFEVDTHKGLRKVSMTTMPGDPVAGDPSVGPVRLVEEVEDQIFELKLPQGDSASFLVLLYYDLPVLVWVKP